ncbi:haloacid dehalogenase type II [Allopusillimonas ginsengisoli]|uniref:haloacid dehalogenase type II n=1 Tax=Allopusillimonas ginsengisoli TaxID=453575 RepID=UPI0039C40E27
MTDERLKDVRVLAFDVFGTVVDWCSSIASEIEHLNPKIDGRVFARAWRAGYQPTMQRVRDGELPWTRIDDLHRMILDDILIEFGMSELDESQRHRLNKAWHRLQAWPDSVQGITRLKTRYITTTLSNGNINLLVNMAKAASLNWDCVLSAEVFKAYKPDPKTYLGVARIFDLRPDQVMLVAAHQNDLDAARECGLLTAYIERPTEFGTDMLKDVSPHPANTLHARTITVLADTLLS